MSTDSDTSGLVARLEVSLSTMAANTAKLVDLQSAIDRRAAHMPIRHPIGNTGLVVSGSKLFIDLGGPSPGRYWTTRILAVSDAGDVATAITGATSADWYVGKVPASGLIDTAGWVYHMEAPPKVAQLTSDPVYVLAEDHLYVVVTGATTTGQQVLAKAVVWDGEATRFTPTQGI